MTVPVKVTGAAVPGIMLHRLFHEGDAHALTLLRVTTAVGLVVDVLPDRCLDLGAATYQGLPLAWTSGAPMRHPADLPRNEWAVRFVGGLLATCGLDNVGPACVDGGQVFPQHGRLGGEPARDVRWGTRHTGGSCHWITGNIIQPGTTLRLRRQILLCDVAPSVRVIDTVVNDGARPEAVMIQYHCNVGEPFVAPGGRVVLPGAATVPRDAAAAEALDRWQGIEPARDGEKERVFRHEQTGSGWTGAYLAPPPDHAAGLYMVRVRYRRRTLPWLWQWRLLSTDAYVIGLEPANCPVKPRAEARRRGALSMLAPGEKITFGVEIGVVPRVAFAGDIAELVSPHTR